MQALFAIALIRLAGRTHFFVVPERATTIEPESKGPSAAIARSTVVFPAPDVPMSAQISPGATAMVDAAQHLVRPARCVHVAHIERVRHAALHCFSRRRASRDSGSDIAR